MNASLLLAISIAGTGESSVALSELFRVAAVALESRAHVRLVTPEQAGLESGIAETCGSTPSCWMKSVSALADARPKYLVILGAVTRENAPSLFSAVVLEVGEPTTAETDEALLARAIAPAGFRPLANGDAAAKFFDELFGEVLRPVLEKNGDWGPAPAASAPALSQRTAPPIPIAPAESALRTPLFVSGLALTAAGAGVLVATIAASPSEERHRVCAGLAPCDVESDFRSAGPVKLAPLAYSLAASGVFFAITSRAFSDDEKLWISAAIGVALGAATYGISAAAD